MTGALSPHLAKLEAEAIGILREVGFSARRPVLLTSLGKDSAVVLHLARKAFFPGRLPYPLMHVDTGWKFRAMLEYRAELGRQPGVELLVYQNQDGIRRGISPLASGAALHTQVMKTEALRQALDLHGFDAIIGGARRDEEKSRAKERVFSLRGPGHSWNPRDQRPELWALWNTRLGEGETLRVFPVSDWTERDIWDYILAEEIPLVPLYFAAPRPVLRRGGTLVMLDDDRMPLAPGETPEIRTIRFRTLGCWPLTGAIESRAATVSDIVEELRLSQASERAGRLIDGEGEASMEFRKREGYF
ncbi:MAG: sulfate adenylyltransferase subunit CysD [Paracraurococcus sp.]|jgi:sulfate adenylyltransferase subunit 2